MSKKRCALLVATTVAGIVLSAPQAMATEPMSMSMSSELTAAVSRASTSETVTRADRDLILGAPEIAARLVDPAAARSESRVVRLPMTPSSPTAARAAIRCFGWSHTVTHRTFVGAVAYRFEHGLTRCFDGVRVTRVYDRFHRVFDKDDFFYVAPGTLQDFLSRVPASTVTSRMAVRVDNCLPLKACLSSKTAVVELTLRGNGAATRTGRV